MGIYGKGMHGFILRELEIGYRAAVVEDQDYVDAYPSAILDLQYAEYMRSSNES